MDATTKQQRTSDRVRAWKQANCDKVLAQKKRYRERHRAEIQESKKLYAAAHRPQINEYRCQYRQAKKCAQELQAQHQLLVPSGSLWVSETAKDLLTEARALPASQEARSLGGIFFLLGTRYLFPFPSLNAFIFFSFTSSLWLFIYGENGECSTTTTSKGSGGEQGANLEAKKSLLPGKQSKAPRIQKTVQGQYTSNNFVNATDEITIHVGDVSWVRVCLKVLGPDARPPHVIDRAGGGWLVRKYALRPPTPPYLREGLARVDRLAPPASPSVVGSIRRRRPARRVIPSCLSRRIIVHCFRHGSGTKRPSTTPPRTGATSHTSRTRAATTPSSARGGWGTRAWCRTIRIAARAGESHSFSSH